MTTNLEREEKTKEKSWKTKTKKFFNLNSKNPRIVVKERARYDKLKNIIQSLLTKQREEMREKIKGLKMRWSYIEPIDHPDKKESIACDGYNVAVDKVNKRIDDLLEQMEGEK